MVRIDVHNHAIPASAVALLQEEPRYGVRIDGRRWSGGKHVDFEIAESFIEPAAKLAELDEKGIDHALISAAPPLLYYHVDAELGEAMARAVNRGLAEFCAAAPERLHWLASAPMQAPERAAAVLREALEDGAIGIEIGTAVADRRLDEPRFEPFWQTAEAVGIPVTLHPAYTEGINPALAPFYFENVLGFLFDTTIAIERLICAGTLDRHPQLELVLLHGGGYFPYQAGRLRHASSVRPELSDAPADPWAYLDRLRFDVITHDARALAYLIDRVGVERVVLGTDLPFDMATPDPIGLIRAAAGEEAVVAIAERNPAHLYRLTN
jgi:aminocarboxymuconate-semialdehyde decarboxylase